MKKGSTVNYLFGDHLGSTAITASSAGAKLGELRYKPWGEIRYTWGTTYTSRQFTGQVNESSLGLYFFNARWYDAALGRFLQADSLVPDPGNPQAWDRFAYGLNAPTSYTDPTGHYYYDPGCDCMVHNKENKNQHPEYLKYKNTSIGLDNVTENNNEKTKNALLNDNLGGNIENANKRLSDQQQIIENEQVNPPIEEIVAVGVLLFGASLIIEGGLAVAETLIVPTIAATPPLTTIAELTMFGATVAIIDINVAYLSYTYRVYKEPEEKQYIEFLPPWGFGD